MSGMPLTFDLGVAELAGTRFAISPLSETVGALGQLSGRFRHDVNLRWMRWAREELARRPLALPHVWPLVVNDRLAIPEFLLPAPSGPLTTIDDALAVMRETAPDDVRASMRRVFGDEPPEVATELTDDPAAGLRAIAAELREAYDRLIAPHWPRIRAVLDADIAYRAQRLAANGAAALFADIHPDLRWQDGRVTVAGFREQTNLTAPGGLVLLPVVLGPPHPTVKRTTSTRMTLRYPARGVGTLWSAGTRPVRGSAVRLLGRQRAELLEALRSPATTTDLARALRVTPSAVSQHLRVLRDSGLVTSERAGRSVLYLTTERGISLLEPRTDEPSA